MSDLLLCIMLSLAGTGAVLFGIRGIFDTKPLTFWKAFAKDLGSHLLGLMLVGELLGSIMYGWSFAGSGAIICLIGLVAAFIFNFLPCNKKDKKVESE